MLSRYDLLCEYGHRGALLLKENSRPYTTGKQFYSLGGFVGETISIDDEVSLALALEKINACCPVCGLMQSSNNIEV